VLVSRGENRTPTTGISFFHVIIFFRLALRLRSLVEDETH